MDIRLKSIRKEKKITQRDIAKHIGVTPSFISRVENDTKDISFKLALQIADYLNVSLDELAGRKTN